MTKAEMRKRIAAARSPRGGWSKTALASLGVPWPPPRGWKQRLIREAGKAKRASRPSIDYAARDAILRGMGFPSYAAYLASELWASIRERVLERDGRQCRLCPREASQVHHTTYTREVLLGRELKWLAAICGGCHRYIEFDRETGTKRPAAEVAERYRRARRRFKAERWREENDPLTAEFRAIVREGEEIMDRKVSDALSKGGKP